VPWLLLLLLLFRVRSNVTARAWGQNLLEYEVIWGILVYGVEAVRSLSRSEQVKTLLAGPSPTSPMRRRLPTPLFPTELSVMPIKLRMEGKVLLLLSSSTGGDACGSNWV
jgi:hypothetical protein